MRGVLGDEKKPAIAKKHRRTIPVLLRQKCGFSEVAMMRLFIAVLGDGEVEQVWLARTGSKEVVERPEDQRDIPAVNQALYEPEEEAWPV